MTALKETVDFYNRNGYVKVSSFLTPEEVETMKKDVSRILNETDVANPGRVEKLTGTQYHIDSITKSCLWFESSAIDEKTGRVNVPIERAVHKIAHGVHLNSKVAHAATFSEKMKSMVRAVSQFEDPAVIQGKFNL